MPQPETTTQTINRAQDLFIKAPDDYRELIRAVLNDERRVAHMRRREDIHQKIYKHVTRLIK